MERCSNCKFNRYEEENEECSIYLTAWVINGYRHEEFRCEAWKPKNESKNCSNCKYSQFGPIGEPCRPQHYRCRLLDEKEVDENFYCNKWKENKEIK